MTAKVIPKISPELSRLLNTTNFANHPPNGGIPASEKKNTVAKIAVKGWCFDRPPDTAETTPSLWTANPAKQ